MSKPFNYGGQAVIEGVMILGQKNVTVAVRRPDGEISTLTKPLSPTYTGRLRKLPFLRGLFVLVEMLILGIKALMYSANVALEEEEAEKGSWLLWGTVALAFALGLALFFLVPVGLIRLVDPYIGSSLVSNLVEGILRIAIFMLYLLAITLMPDIRRVFAYHGAEHKTINAYEDGVELEVDKVQKYSTAHARCGTGFILIVLVIAILVFVFLGRPPLWLHLLSRIALLPVIAGIGYEVMRLGAAHRKNRIVRFLLAPSLALQSLTTRQPNNQQVEVGIAALRTVLDADSAAAEEPIPPPEAPP